MEKQALLHYDLKWIITIAQCFGLMPVIGILSQNPKDLYFCWYSIRALLSLLIISGSTFTMLTSFYRTFINKFTLHQLRSFIFNANSAVGGIIFFNLAKRWPKLINSWTQVEISLEQYNKNKQLRRKFYLILIVIMLAAIVEHILSIIYAYNQIKHSPNKFESYCKRNYPHLFDFFEFSTPLAVFAIVMNILNVFSWNYLDAFLMIISVALTQKFRQVTTRVMWAYRTRIKQTYHWMKLREDYNKISILCKVVNAEISSLIVVSFATNMFFIMAQLYRSLNLRSSAMEGVYFTFSFSLLLLRTIAVTLFGSNIHDESKRSMNFLMSLDSETYNCEIERFAYQIHCQPVALTGNDFFTITRGLLFGMAGAIVTYELFLIQSINYDD